MVGDADASRLFARPRCIAISVVIAVIGDGGGGADEADEEAEERGGVVAAI